MRARSRFNVRDVRVTLLPGMAFPSRHWEDIAMKASSLFSTNLAVAILSVVPLLCGSSTAWSQPTTTSLPDILVEAPKHVTAQHKPKHYAAANSTGSARVAITPGSSLPSGEHPWLGCSGSAGAYAYTGCRNIGPGGVPFKTYNECAENGLKGGWRSGEISFYCSSLALKQ